MEPRKRPHSPADLKPEWFDHYPDEMYEAFNVCIYLNWDGEKAIFYQEDAVVVMSYISLYPQDEIIRNRWHIPTPYEAMGWDIVPDTDNERALPRFTFRLPAIMSRPQP